MTTQPTIEELKAAYELRVLLMDERWEITVNSTDIEEVRRFRDLVRAGYVVGFRQQAQPYIAALETENQQQAEEIRLLTAERDRYRAERDGMWTIAARAENERQRDQRLMFGQED